MRELICDSEQSLKLKVVVPNPIFIFTSGAGKTSRSRLCGRQALLLWQRRRCLVTVTSRVTEKQSVEKLVRIVCFAKSWPLFVFSNQLVICLFFIRLCLSPVLLNYQTIMSVCIVFTYLVSLGNQTLIPHSEDTQLQVKVLHLKYC